MNDTTKLDHLLAALDHAKQLGQALHELGWDKALVEAHTIEDALANAADEEEERLTLVANGEIDA